MFEIKKAVVTCRKCRHAGAVTVSLCPECILTTAADGVVIRGSVAEQLNKLSNGPEATQLRKDLEALELPAYEYLYASTNGQHTMGPFLGPQGSLDPYAWRETRTPRQTEEAA